ncbi:MAG: pyridoxal phosphate-dependent aminotransferase [Pseudomonadota bacterium]
MGIELSARVARAKPSQTVVVTAKAAAMRAEGRDVIGLGAGEPDFDTPAHVKKAATEAIASGDTKYTAVDGTRALKDAIIAKFVRENTLRYSRDEIAVSSGGKQAIYNCFQALLDPGDEVIIPAPYWVSYPDMALLADAEPVIIAAGPEAGFRITPAQLQRAITPRTRLLVLNSPSNPTGAVYSEAELAALAEVLLRHPKVAVLTDDLYEHIRWADEPFKNILNTCPALADRTLVVNGVSKAYAMTGWRIGYAAGPATLVRAMVKVQGQSTSGPSSISQAAAVAALEGGLGCVKAMCRAFKERHDFVVHALDGLPGVACEPNGGAFYAFADFREAIAGLAGIEDDIGLCERLIEHAGVAVVPGSAFGAPGHVRVSYATSVDVLREAVNRIASVLTGT